MKAQKKGKKGRILLSSCNYQTRGRKKKKKKAKKKIAVTEWSSTPVVFILLFASWFATDTTLKVLVSGQNTHSFLFLPFSPHILPVARCFQRLYGVPFTWRERLFSARIRVKSRKSPGPPDAPLRKIALSGTFGENSTGEKRRPRALLTALRRRMKGRERGRVVALVVFAFHGWQAKSR